MSRRRRPARPAAASARAARLSQSSGEPVADTVITAPGSFGTWVNGEMPAIHPDSRRICPNRAITTTTASTDQAPATQARGASPNSATAAPATASEAGKIGRASWRERVEIAVGAVAGKKKRTEREED